MVRDRTEGKATPKRNQEKKEQTLKKTEMLKNRCNWWRTSFLPN